MIDPRVLLIAVAIALAVWVGDEIAIGLHKLRDGERKVAAKIVHVLKKLPHPHHEDAPEDEGQ